MNELEQTLTELATLNYSGAIFLLAYGATWLLVTTGLFFVIL